MRNPRLAPPPRAGGLGMAPLMCHATAACPRLLPLLACLRGSHTRHGLLDCDRRIELDEFLDLGAEFWESRDHFRMLKAAEPAAPAATQAATKEAAYVQPWI